ncbi:MAG: glycosyltransferase family 4 protein, partial [Armatimonadota bacterium]
MSKLRILHVGSSMPDDWGGIERYIATLGRAQIAQGHNVTVAAPGGSPLAMRWGGPCPDIWLRRKFDIKALRRYLRLFRSQKFDVVVTHFSPDFIIPVFAARLARAGKTILTRHLVEPFRRDRTMIYSRLYDGFIGVSEAAASSLLASGLEASRVKAVQGGCQALQSLTNREVSRSYHAVKGMGVGFFGRLVSEKGVDVLIEARRLAKADWSVHVFGDGPDRGRLQSLAEGLEVAFHGRVEEVGSAMDAMDVVAMPSRWSEAFSIAALEALSLGKPIVASRVGGLPELFVHDSPGQLV